MLVTASLAWQTVSLTERAIVQGGVEFADPARQELHSCMNDLYINIGSEKCCLFVKMSSFLLRALKRHPVLYYAVEEALECARIGYFGIGIIMFSQLLKLFNKKTPGSRNVVAHEALIQRPSKHMFEETVEAFKSAASEQSDRERGKHGSIAGYQQSVVTEWQEFIKEHHRT